MADKKEERYKIYVNMNGEKVVFKRYGKDETDIRNIFEKQCKELYPDDYIFVELIEKDKTHTL